MLQLSCKLGGSEFITWCVIQVYVSVAICSAIPDDAMLELSCN